MRTSVTNQTASSRPETKRVAKKDQILALYLGGITEVADLAAITQTRPSYVASVLQQAQHLPSYFDLYTPTRQPMNVYSKFFAGKLGFKDEETSRHSVELIDNLHRQFELAGDRAGQHHALLMALLMFDRARWSGKEREAEVFRRWLAGQLQQNEAAGPSVGGGGNPGATETEGHGAGRASALVQAEGPDEEAGESLDRQPAHTDERNRDQGGVPH